MIGNPKYNYGQVVSFVCEDKTKTGEVYIIDKYGTFEDNSDVSYDIMIKNDKHKAYRRDLKTGERYVEDVVGDCLYKHIREDYVWPMANLKDYIDLNKLHELVAQRYIYVQKHPTADLYLYNYSKSCQMDKVWNDITCMCRGLVVDNDFNIVARPFVKFFNYEEITDKSQIPDLPFEVYEKLDGSLGIMYWIGNKPYICTRGSFNSDQGNHGTDILYEKYSKYFDQLDKSKTYLFEIIWNEDHHCISYGDLDDIFLIGVIDTATGAEDDIYNWQHIFKCTKRYDGITDYKKIREMFSGDNREGFVVKFSNNFRIKMKYESYFKIHFLRCMVSPKTVYNLICDDKLDEARETLKDLDEENKIYFENLVNKFRERYTKIELECIDFLAALKNKYGEYYNINSSHIINDIKENKKYSCVLFKMARGQKYEKVIWNLIKREGYNE